MRRLLNAILFFLLCGVTLFAQSTPQVMPSFQELMSEFTILQEDHTENQKLLSTVYTGLKELTQTASNDAILENSIKLYRQISEVISAIQQEQEQQVAFKNTISRYSGDRQLLRQEQTYLSHYLDELQKFGREQEGAMAYLQQAQKQLSLRIANMPPPPRFTGNFDIEFVLIATDRNNAFYITKEPLSQEQIFTIWKAMHPELNDQELQKIQEDFKQKGICLYEARQIAACMGRLFGGFPCTLPSEAQVAALREYGQTLPKAVWLDGKQNLEPVEKEALLRFGMTIGRVWDPTAKLGAHQNRNAVISEIPWAKYPELGCVLTTVIDAGRAKKRAIIEKLLDETATQVDQTDNTPEEDAQ